MESNYNYEHIVNKAYNAIDTQDRNAIRCIYSKNRTYDTVLTIYNVLFWELDSSISQDIKKFCLVAVQDMLITFRIPIVLWINDSRSIDLLVKLAKDCSIEDSVNIILELCLEIFWFDKKRMFISKIASGWKDINPRKAFPYWDYKGMSAFESYYWMKQNIIEDDQNLDELPFSRKRELKKEISNFLETQEFENSEFNFMEDGQAIIYFSQMMKHLENLKDLNEDEFFEDKKQENKILEPMEPMEPINHTNFLEKDNHNWPTMELRYRKYFELNEKLKVSEDMEIEYKNYGWEFNEITDKSISKAVCGFLNRYGGRILIGVNDKGVVVGIKLTAKQRDEAKLHIQGLMNAFEHSNINSSHLVDIIYLPIIDPENCRKIPGLFVMKIIVKQGDVSKLYSISKESCQFYQRNDAQTVLLKPGQVLDMLNPQNYRKKKDEKDFIDPKADSLVDSIEENEVREGNTFPSPFAYRQSGDGKSFLGKVTSSAMRLPEVWINGLPKSIAFGKAEEIIYPEHFKKDIAEKGVLQNEGFVRFYDEFAAQEYQEYLNSIGVSAFIKDVYQRIKV